MGVKYFIDKGLKITHTSDMPAVEPNWVARLRDDIANRRIESGLQFLDSRRAALESIDIKTPDAGVMLGYLAQWIDIGFADVELLRALLSRFPSACRHSLPLIDYLHLRMAEGLLAMADENFEGALRHFAFVESVEEEFARTDLLAISNFWAGRCLRKQGRYDDALEYTARGKRLALQLGHPPMAAVMQVLESWLFFQKGRFKEAKRSLIEADSVLAGTDDHVSRGNIQSSYGRIARREGDYDHALEHFSRAIEFYKMRDAQHRNLARSLVNIAFVKRLLSERLKRRLDALSAERGRIRGPESGARVRETRARFDKYREEANAHLEEAWAIYARQHNHRGMGTVHLNRAFLLLDGFELDRAVDEARQSFALAQEKHDYILMARARTLQCMVEETKFEEQVDEGDPERHARAARQFADEAVEFARHTQNRRLLARALVWQGLALSNDHFDNPEAARQCASAATDLLKPEGGDYTWEDLQTLNGRLLAKSRLDSDLRAWSQGLVSGKTFQQISEEFAALLIPKVWEREHRKVSRVAARLSISPKKVRRALRKAGIVEQREEPEEGE